MLAVEHNLSLSANVALKGELFEIHRSQISLHHAKTDYTYPTIRLPYAFSKLAGLPSASTKLSKNERWHLSWPFLLQRMLQ
jgi:hypothetical protein